MPLQSSLPRAALLLGTLMLSAGCSLVTIRSQVEPLPPNDLKARLMTRDLVTVFADRVKLAVDQISSSTEDAGVRAAALRWQIGAIGACRRAGLRQDPREALVDVWGLCVQQRDFLTSGAGASLFGPAQATALAAAEQLVADVEQIARATVEPGLRTTMEQLVAGYAARYPIANLDFNREPILPLWLQAAADEGRVTTVGSSPEVVQDVADRLRILGEGVPEALSWRTELALTEREEDIEELRALLERLDAGLGSIARLAETSPELAATAARELQRELAPSIARVDARWGESLATLVSQREAVVQDLERMQAALTATLASEREALTAAVDRQRASVMAEAGGIAADVTDRALTHLRTMVREALLLLILLAAVVLGLPFVAGYLVGRTRGRAGAVRE